MFVLSSIWLIASLFQSQISQRAVQRFQSQTFRHYLQNIKNYRRRAKMQSSSSRAQSNPIIMQQCPKFVQVDQSWLSSVHVPLKQLLLTCPICYSIPLDYPYECMKCQRIFCKRDYEKVVLSQNQTQNRCPICKLSPWVRKQKIHITYKHMFDSLRLRCKICADITKSQSNQTDSTIPKQMTKEELINHLQQTHDMFLSQDSILYDYIFVSQNGTELRLNWLQNLQINVRKSMQIEMFEIGGNQGNVLTVNIKQMTCQHPTLGRCSIVANKSKSIKRNKQYLVWTVDISDKQQYFLFEHQINQPQSYFQKSQKWRYVFYSNQLQPRIEKNYQEFLKNQRLNEFCLDVRQTRFRISFQQMSQTNTYTKRVKPILRVPFVLK